MKIDEPERIAFILCLGVILVSEIGTHWFNNKYISVAYILLIGIIYLHMKMKELHGQQRANITD